VRVEAYLHSFLTSTLRRDKWVVNLNGFAPEFVLTCEIGCALSGAAGDPSLAGA